LSDEFKNVELLGLTPNELFSKIVKDLYFGNGKPALTERMKTVEDQQNMFRDSLEKAEKWQAGMNKLVIGTLISSVGGLILIIIDLLIRH
jgi:hypothetical protein